MGEDCLPPTPNCLQRPCWMRWRRWWTTAWCARRRSTAARRFYRRVAKVVDIPWQLTAGADFAYPETQGRKAPGTDAINWYIAHLRRATAHDAEVARLFIEVSNL